MKSHSDRKAFAVSGEQVVHIVMGSLPRPYHSTLVSCCVRPALGGTLLSLPQAAGDSGAIYFNNSIIGLYPSVAGTAVRPAGRERRKC